MTTGRINQVSIQNETHSIKSESRFEKLNSSKLLVELFYATRT